MGLRINTNVPSIAVQRLLSQSQRESEGAMKALASGDRFENPEESSADYSIAERIRSQTRGLEAAKQNSENAQSFIEVAEGGLNEQNNLLIRMRELAVQAASDTYSDEERDLMQTEFLQLQEELTRIADTTRFGSTRLLSGENKEYEFQVGADKGAENVITYKNRTDTRASALGVDGDEIDGKSDARDSLEDIDDALLKVAQARANFGAVQSRLDSTINNTAVQIENLQSAHSRLADTDVAKAVSDVARSQAMRQYQIAVLQQANEFPGNVLKLIA
jgi:flagellin